MFDKFLGNQPPPKPEKKKHFNEKPDNERKYPKRMTERHQPNGRVIRKLRKRDNTGSKHYKVKRKYKRESQRRHRAKTGMAYDRAYNATLKRKFIQKRWNASKRGQEWLLTYEEWLLMWASCENVYHEDKWYRPHELSESQKRVPHATWVDRIDKDKPWQYDNMAVMFKGKPVPKRNMNDK